MLTASLRGEQYSMEAIVSAISEGGTDPPLKAYALLAGYWLGH
jgi:hypothetical protein